MFEGLFQPMHLVVILVVIPVVFYILTLRRALKSCSAVSRTMAPNGVWILLIPVVNIVWHFFVVSKLARSLGNEFKRRNAPDATPKPGKSVGIAMCVFTCVAQVTGWSGANNAGWTLWNLLGGATGIAGFICWIVYWVQIAGYSRALRVLPEVGNTA